MASNSQSQGNVTNNQYVRLGRAISGSKMESNALGYMNVDDEKIKQLKEARRDDTELFVRDVIQELACQPENEKNQLRVSYHREVTPS